jgi:hypothetical protein
MGRTAFDLNGPMAVPGGGTGTDRTLAPGLADAGAAVCPASGASSFVTVHRRGADGGFLASGASL